MEFALLSVLVHVVLQITQQVMSYTVVHQSRRLENQKYNIFGR